MPIIYKSVDIGVNRDTNIAIAACAFMALLQVLSILYLSGFMLIKMHLFRI